MVTMLQTIRTRTFTIEPFNKAPETYYVNKKKKSTNAQQSVIFDKIVVGFSWLGRIVMLTQPVGVVVIAEERVVRLEFKVTWLLCAHVITSGATAHVQYSSPITSGGAFACSTSIGLFNANERAQI